MDLYTLSSFGLVQMQLKLRRRSTATEVMRAHSTLKITLPGRHQPIAVTANSQNHELSIKNSIFCPVSSSYSFVAVHTTVHPRSYQRGCQRSLPRPAFNFIQARVGPRVSGPRTESGAIAHARTTTNNLHTEGGMCCWSFGSRDARIACGGSPQHRQRGPCEDTC